MGRDAGNVSGGLSKGVRGLTLSGRETHRGRPTLGRVARAGKGEVAQSLGAQQVSTEEVADLEPPTVISASLSMQWGAHLQAAVLTHTPLYFITLEKNVKGQKIIKRETNISVFPSLRKSLLAFWYISFYIYSYANIYVIYNYI